MKGASEVASAPSGPLLMFWLEGGESALAARLGEIGVKGVETLGFTFVSCGPCSPPGSPRIGDFGDLGGVELTIIAVLDSLSSPAWRCADGGDITMPLPLFWTRELSGLVGLSAGGGGEGMTFSKRLSEGGVGVVNSFGGGGESGVLMPSGLDGLRGDNIIALGLASPLDDCGSTPGRLLLPDVVRLNDLTLSESLALLRLTRLQSDDIIFDIDSLISLSTAITSHSAN